MPIETGLGEGGVTAMNAMRRKAMGLPAALPLMIALANGLLLAFAVVFCFQSNFINTQVHGIVRSVTTDRMTNEEKALALLRETYDIVRFGLRHADSADLKRVQRLPIASFDELIFLPAAACGDASAILFRLLDDAGIPSRMAQMRCGGRDGCHIIDEAFIGGRWVALDPLFNLAFRNDRGQLATFKEISANWQSFRKQAPPGYSQRYRYEAVRYTNWQKIPIVMPALRRVLVAIFGEARTSEISLRSYLMFPNRLYFAICLLGLLVVNCVGAGIALRKFKLQRHGVRLTVIQGLGGSRRPLTGHSIGHRHSNVAPIRFRSINQQR
jgi:hypothetical protein